LVNIWNPQIKWKYACLYASDVMKKINATKLSKLYTCSLSCKFPVEKNNVAAPNANKLAERAVTIKYFKPASIHFLERSIANTAGTVKSANPIKIVTRLLDITTRSIPVYEKAREEEEKSVYTVPHNAN